MTNFERSKVGSISDQLFMAISTLYSDSGVSNAHYIIY